MKLFLLDAYALIYRSYYAFINNPRINSKGQNTGTILGFVNTLLEVIEKEKPTHLGVAFDPKGGSFRNRLFEQYKAQREETPEDIRWAVPQIKEILEAFNIPVYQITDFEADDVIGTLARQANEQNINTFLMTPDKDYCQLVTENVKLYKPGYGDQKYTILGPDEVLEKYGLKDCSQVIDLLGLMGDSADNIPGCPGVGPKTAQKLLQEFGTIENLLENTEKIAGKLKDKIEENKENILFSKKLATIVTDVNIELNLEELEINRPDFKKIEKILKELELVSLARRINGKKETEKTEIISKPKKEQKQPDLFDIFQADEQPSDIFSNLSGDKSLEIKCQYINNEKDIAELKDKILARKKMSFCIKSTGDRFEPAEISCFCISIEKRECYMIPIGQGKLEECKKTIAMFKDIFENSEIEKTAYNLKPVIQLLWNIGIELKGNNTDTLIAHYILQPEQNHKFEYIVYSTLGVDISRDGNTDNAEECALNLELGQKLTEELEKENQTELFRKIEMPLVEVLAYMEKNGVLIDSDALGAAANLYKEKLETISREIFEMSGEKFNISSPKQVGYILFEKMQLGGKQKKTKTGGFSTNEDVLEELRDVHPIVEKIIEYRALKKLLNTYIEALPELINRKTGKIHTFFNQTVTSTGRLSSSGPNLQNIPVRNQEGREIRKAFIPEPGCKFYSADYSQIELRIMAHSSRDKSMIENFESGFDIHAWTAAKIFHKEIGQVTKEERSKAKSANFGIIYGISTFGLARNMKVSRTEAKELIDNYFETYPGVKDYITESIENAKRNGYITTMFGRKRYLPDINSHNAVVRGYAERNAVNAPIQGSAADIIKIAMINIYEKFKEAGLKSTMILQVHDELNFNVAQGEEAVVKQIVKQQMEKAANLLVPLVADDGWGQNWLEAH